MKDSIPMEVTKTLKHPTRRRRRAPSRYVKAVNNGYYFRIKIPSAMNKNPVIETQAKANTPPSNPSKITTTTTSIGVPQNTIEPPIDSERVFRRFYKWFKNNLPVMTLNFGSICILLGFTRSDVLELRAMTMTGQMTFATYNLAQATILWPSVAWSTLFASVNAWKIWDVFHERNAEVHLTADQEDVFVEHFMPHGITPAQFEKLERKAKKFHLSKGGFLIRKGGKLDRVFLVTHGSTHAHILGRELSGVSTRPDTRGDQKEGGDSGAWIGEMTFLDRLWERDQGDTMDSEKTSRSEALSRASAAEKFAKKGSGISLYTVLADEDCSVMSWSYEDLAELMESSVDLRAALTRAMTSAVVGKVINLSVSHTQVVMPSWSTWLTDWSHNDGARVEISDVDDND